MNEIESRSLSAKSWRQTELSGFTEISDINTIAESLSFVDDPKLKVDNKITT